MPTLDWIGKDKVVNHHQLVPFRVLERRYSFDQAGQHSEDNGSENMVIQGDNLEALKALLPRYGGRVKCIYIDPPYNTGNEGWIYSDSVNDPRIRRWLGEAVGREGEDLTRHDKWLCMMYPRLKLLRKLLAPDGVFLASIGDDELADLLFLVREIFGRVNAVFVWKSRSKPTNAGRAKYRPQKVMEYVVMFTRDEDRIFHVGQKEDDYAYPNRDQYGAYRTSTILTSNLGSYRRETMRFAIAGYTPPPDKRWKAGAETIQELYDSHRLLFTQDGTPMEKIYDNDNEAVLTPLYTYIAPQISGTAESGKTQLNRMLGRGHGFDTVKPLGLLEYLIGISTGPGDIVLDSFAGTGTTAHAVLTKNQADGGGRRFILVEMMDYADSITARRIKQAILGYGKGKNAVEGVGGSFSFYDLGEPLLPGGSLNRSVDPEKIREYVWFTETKRPYTPDGSGHPYYLGANNNAAYYLCYEPDRTTVLDYGFLSTITRQAETTVVYADRCAIGGDALARMGVIFKKISRDISRL